MLKSVGSFLDFSCVPISLIWPFFFLLLFLHSTFNTHVGTEGEIGGSLRRYSMATTCFHTLYLPSEIRISVQMPHIKNNTGLWYFWLCIQIIMYRYLCLSDHNILSLITERDSQLHFKTQYLWFCTQKSTSWLLTAI